MRISQSFAQEEDITPEQRQILILKTKIRIDTLVQQSIQAEIEYNTGNITESEYTDIIEDNLTAMEELSLFQNALEDEDAYISLDEIQRLKLAEYQDDSAEVQDLPVLAYIKEKTGHVVIYNLNGSTKL